MSGGRRSTRPGRARIGVAAGVLVGIAAACTVTPTPPATTPSPLAFAETTVGDSTTEMLTITNTDPAIDLVIESTGISGPSAGQFADAFDDDGQVTVIPGASTEIAVTYAPTAAGDHEATLRVSYAETSVAVPLDGSAVAPDAGSRPLVASPAPVAFDPTVVGQTASVTVQLTNAGSSGTIVVDGAQVVGAGAAMFDASLPASPRTLGPGQTADAMVTFTPTAAGHRSALLRVPHDGTNGDLLVPVTATAHTANPPVVLYRVNAGGPALPAPAGPPWAADSAAVPSPNSNVATSGNAVASTMTPVDMTHPSVPAGTPAAVFQDERSDKPATPNLAYAFPVVAGTDVEVRLHLRATAPGRVFDIRIDGAVVAHDVDVFEQVGAHKALVLAFPVVSDGTIDVSFSHGAGNPAVAGLEVVSATEPAPATLAVDVGSVEFAGPIVRQTATQQVVLTNIGSDGPLTVTSTAISGPQAKQFADRFVNGQPLVLGPGQSTTVPVAFLAAGAGRQTAALSIAHTGANSPFAVSLTGVAAPPPSTVHPSFGKSQLAGAGVSLPTSLQFGPDGRLYVAQMNGVVKALTVIRSAENQYMVTATETINLVNTLPNRNDNGVLNPSVTGRLVTGLLVAGTATEPVVYVDSTDPRIGAGPEGTDLNLDTNSGIVSRLRRTGGVWTKLDLVRGLPRSEENHTGNGLLIDPTTGDLLLAHGGHTNKGAPSHNFAFLPEYALSAAVLAIDLDAIGDTTYDLPTLDDQDRPGTVDANDPFGGNDGRNMARLVPGGPVRVYAPGFRNPYDLVRTQAGALYTIDNGGNAGWGGAPQPDGTGGTCTNGTQETSDTDSDALVRITGEGFYGGHPNPTRGNPANTFNPTNPQSPVAAGNPVECDYRTEVERGALASYPFSTNGLDEYTADNFGGALQGDLLTAGHDQSIQRIQLDATGTAVTHSSPLFSSAAALPLDVTALGDADPFPGTIWVADFSGNKIVVFEPADFVCTGADDPGLDEDGDGFDNADELDNATNPCSAADMPPDADGDLTSDRNDPDDDNDGLSDTSDRFALDSANGRATSLPVTYTWDNDAPPAGGLLDLGFTGLMTNGVADYATLFDPSKMTAGGAAGVVTVDEVGEGDALGPLNSQHDGFQFGIDVDAASAPFVVHTRLRAPFTGVSPVGSQAFGVFFGTGTQDDYVKLTVAANGGNGGFALVREVGGSPNVLTAPGPDWPAGGPTVDLFLRVDPGAATVQASYSLNGAAPVTVGPAQSVPGSWFAASAGPAVGIISTSSGPAPVFPATWDFLEVG